MTQPNLIPSSKVRERLGGVSESTLYRYMGSKTMNFPKPFTFARRHMWDAAEIDQFVIDRRNAAFARPPEGLPASNAGAGG